MLIPSWYGPMRSTAFHNKHHLARVVSSEIMTKKAYLSTASCDSRRRFALVGRCWICFGLSWVDLGRPLR